jgi:hypothetical protein
MADKNKDYELHAGYLLDNFDNKIVDVFPEKNCSICIGCGGENEKVYVNIQLKYGSIESICFRCYENNIKNKWMTCHCCFCKFLIDFTKLKKGDVLQGGIAGLNNCLKCLKKIDESYGIAYVDPRFIKKRNEQLYNEKQKKCTHDSDDDCKCYIPENFELNFDEFDYDDDMGYTTDLSEWNCNEKEQSNNRKMRIAGEKFYVKEDDEDYKEEIKRKKNKQEECLNITKKVSNNKQFDLKNFGRKGTMTSKDVQNLLKIQEYKCDKCGEEVLTFGYKSRCCYQFSIDRINNGLPHDKNNIKISCYFCNCADHPLYDKTIKTRCGNGCICVKYDDEKNE